MQLKRISLWILCLGLMTMALVGCGGGGGSGIPQMNTTITGFLTPPEVTTPGIIANVRGLSSSDILSKLAAGGTCKVNGQVADFSLATATRFFQISDIPPCELLQGGIHLSEPGTPDHRSA